jgi:photosystem II stability/assembly factor-like uncharacterized protein
MKNLLAIILLTATSLGASSQQYGWKDIGANIPGDSLGHDLSDVFFVTDNEGWITSSTHAEIYHTADGGETFEVQTTPLGATIAIHMLDENHGYAGGDGGWIYKTENGGDEWTMLGSIGTKVLDISFPPGTSPDNPIGYACGGSGNVWEITSILTNLNSGSSSDFSGISAPSVNNVLVCGGNRVYYYDGFTFVNQVPPTGTFNDIHLINDLEGWVVGNGGVIGHTNEGGSGLSWGEQTNPDLQNRGLYGVFFIDSNNGWAVGFEGILLKTTDGGNNWIEVGEDLQNFFYNGVHFTSATNGYIVGNNRTLLKYTEVSGIGERQQQLAFELYPNPCRDKIQITSSKLQNNSQLPTAYSKLEILGISGRKVWEYENSGVRESEMFVDVSHLPAGLYLVKLQTEAGVGVRKIIKQ